METDQETIRFTVELDKDLVDALDDYRIFLANRARDATGTMCKVSRNAAIDGLIRPQLFPEDQ